jgi:hypothetical protein
MNIAKFILADQLQEKQKVAWYDGASRSQS